MNQIKKNQIVIYAIVLMLVVAGYLKYIENVNAIEISANSKNTTNIGDATLVNNNEIINNENIEKDSEQTESEQSKEESEEANLTKEQTDSTSNNIIGNENEEYFTNSKLEREKIYSQMLETYQKILENATVSEEQKSIASNEITKINNNRNAIMICENLIAIKGFEQAVILANGESVNVIIKAKELSLEEIAQIQNIITREMETSIENIHIMKK